MSTDAEVRKVLDGMSSTYQETYDRYGLNKPNKLSWSKEDVAKFNKIYITLRNSSLNTIVRTPSGGISTDKNAAMGNPYSWDIKDGTGWKKITVILGNDIYTIQIGRFGDSVANKSDISSYQAFNIMRKELAKDGIDLDDYAVTKEEGMEIKKTIPSPLIEIYPQYISDETGPGIDNVFHLDFNSAYPSGLVATHPEFRKTIERVYSQRKTNPKFKAAMNYFIGCCQSPKSPWNARWAQFSKDAIVWTIEQMTNLAAKIKRSGREVIGFNTDGIFVKGFGPDDTFEDEMYGADELGHYKRDEWNMKFRAKSKGAYEFIGCTKKNPKPHYEAVLRGSTRLDVVKPREEWSWGDIYNSSVITYLWSNVEGFVPTEEIFGGEQNGW